MSLTVSCIVPAYNAARWLGEALDSVLGQTRPPDEIIVVDDGSTDDTPAVLERYGGRVTVQRQANGGPPVARNSGLAAATGEMIAFHDADDIWQQDKLARQLDHFAQKPGLLVSLTHLRNFWIDELREEAAALSDQALAKPAVPGWVFQTMLARREAFAIIGAMAPHLRIGDDTDWFMRARDKGVALEMLPDVLVLRRIHHDNLTRTPTKTAALADIVADSLRRRRAGARET